MNTYDLSNHYFLDSRNTVSGTPQDTSFYLSDIGGVKYFQLNDVELTNTIHNVRDGRRSIVLHLSIDGGATTDTLVIYFKAGNYDVDDVVRILNEGIHSTKPFGKEWYRETGRDDNYPMYQDFRFEYDESNGCLMLLFMTDEEVVSYFGEDPEYDESSSPNLDDPWWYWYDNADIIYPSVNTKEIDVVKEKSIEITDLQKMLGMNTSTITFTKNQQLYIDGQTNNSNIPQGLTNPVEEERLLAPQNEDLFYFPNMVNLQPDNYVVFCSSALMRYNSNGYYRHYDTNHINQTEMSDVLAVVPLNSEYGSRVGFDDGRIYYFGPKGSSTNIDMRLYYPNGEPVELNGGYYRISLSFMWSPQNRGGLIG